MFSKAQDSNLLWRKGKIPTKVSDSNECFKAILVFFFVTIIVCNVYAFDEFIIPLPQTESQKSTVEIQKPLVPSSLILPGEKKQTSLEISGFSQVTYRPGEINLLSYLHTIWRRVPVDLNFQASRGGEGVHIDSASASLERFSWKLAIGDQFSNIYSTSRGAYMAYSVNPDLRLGLRYNRGYEKGFSLPLNWNPTHNSKVQAEFGQNGTWYLENSLDYQRFSLSTSATRLQTYQSYSAFTSLQIIKQFSVSSRYSTLLSGNWRQTQTLSINGNFSLKYLWGNGGYTYTWYGDRFISSQRYWLFIPIRSWFNEIGYSRQNTQTSYNQNEFIIRSKYQPKMKYLSSLSSLSCQSTFANKQAWFTAWSIGTSWKVANRLNFTTETGKQNGQWKNTERLNFKIRQGTDISLIYGPTWYLQERFADKRIGKNGVYFILTKQLTFNPSARGEITGKISDYTGAAMENVIIILDNRHEIASDKNGEFRIKKVDPGQHNITLDVSSIPAYLSPTIKTQKIAVKARHTTHVEFLLTKMLKISGVVWGDENGNGVPDPGEERIENAVLSLNTGVKTFSDADGVYTFNNLFPGTYKVTIEESYLPEGCYLISPSSWNVSLGIDQEISSINFIVGIKRRPIIFE
jgi:hypothetical protein